MNVQKLHEILGKIIADYHGADYTVYIANSDGYYNTKCSTVHIVDNSLVVINYCDGDLEGYELIGEEL